MIGLLWLLQLLSSQQQASVFSLSVAASFSEQPLPSLSTFPSFHLNLSHIPALVSPLVLTTEDQPHSSLNLKTSVKEIGKIDKISSVLGAEMYITVLDTCVTGGWHRWGLRNKHRVSAHGIGVPV